MDLRYAADGIPADVEEIRQALAAKRRWVRLTDGSVAELSQRVASLAAATHDTLGDATVAELPRHVLGEVAAWSELAEHVALDARLTSWTERLRELSASATPEPVAGLIGDLRSYQKIGLAWLQFLSELGAGGILADDMGLGKTIQTLAVVAWRRERDGPMPSLVVAPTSVAPNWIREAERFVPGLKCILLHGLGRHAHYEDVPQADLVVTTYALLRRDVERLRDIRFRYVILDEAQQIKNHAAATTAAAKSLPAEARLALTGTPIENRLLELWSILDFVNPGMLGSWRSFSRRYERPVVAALGEVPLDDDADALADPSAAPETFQQAAVDEAAALRARIRPFVMRRTKADVESDLPPKIETDVIVDLTPAQHRAYAALVAATREDLARRLAADGFERNRMVVLTALLRLRQMACDPRLVDPRFRPQDSAKLEAFRELTAEVIASGRRALVFSQFVELLTLLRTDLDQRGIEYAYLDGRTRDRPAVLRRLQRGHDAAVPAQPARGRHGHQSHRSRRGHPPRPVVESGGRGAGDRSRAPDRPAQDGVGLPDHRGGHDRGSDPAAEAPEAGAREHRHRRRSRLAQAAQRDRHHRASEPAVTGRPRRPVAARPELTRPRRSGCPSRSSGGWWSPAAWSRAASSWRARRARRTGGARCWRSCAAACGPASWLPRPRRRLPRRAATRQLLPRPTSWTRRGRRARRPGDRARRIAGVGGRRLRSSDGSDSVLPA